MPNTLAIINELAEDEKNIATDLSDIIAICKHYTILGNGIQRQIEYIMENGIEEAINSGKVNSETLPHIRDFLKSITDRTIGLDAVDQCFAVIMMIDNYELKHPRMKRVGN
jgi:hypothetical protein